MFSIESSEVKKPGTMRRVRYEGKAYQPKYSTAQTFIIAITAKYFCHIYSAASLYVSVQTDRLFALTNSQQQLPQPFKFPSSWPPVAFVSILAILVMLSPAIYLLIHCFWSTVVSTLRIAPTPAKISFFLSASKLLYVRS